ncbi:putative MFS family arabinose efflux permease [Branchiibius hedensis]|uniref:Predicted arabinose efflux permease, MFS family n=1 Tax=Branchiibius hedensis TaxID=672460 RepID=A0A2Y8ZPD5_9MICO|nr:MFS transporter [Branchiibius hedensis]PWJ25408.1 putative MFS family arabinose efflux permease [Branchiibius hedensis]SSA34221.1 Predicted arabinose efflux permease, MFS family [Branchiibius hedensis]
MSLQPYQSVLSIRDARRVLLLGFLLRMPIFSAGIILTLHVVTHLGHSYADAGLVAAAATIAIAISGPWRGRLLDRMGLRRVLVPSMIVSAVCWSIAPFVGYVPLLVLAVIGGLFVVPTFSIIRQGVIAAVPDDQRRTALSLDGMSVELAFMVGPVIVVWLTTFLPTSWVLFGIEMLGVVLAALLWWANPALRSAEVDESEVGATSRRSWFKVPFVAICLAATASTIVLGGSDVAIVAAMRHWDAVSQLAVVLIPWSFGSLVGGLVYGAMSRGFSPFILLLMLALTTVPMAFAPNMWVFAILAVFSGLFCAPTITATVDAVSRVVPAVARGEAMGWHGSFMTAGSALGAPLAGVAIDAGGFGAGLLLVSAIGAAIAVGGGAAMLARSRVLRSRHALVA